MQLPFLSKSDFFKHALTLIGGTSIGQLIPLISAPILTRLYSPEDYGVLGIYIAISSMLGILATFRYASAIILPSRDEDAQILIGICISFSFVVTLVSFIFTFFLIDHIAYWLNLNEAYKEWLWLCPISVLFSGINAALAAYANRIGRYKILSFDKVLSGLLTASISISFGIYKQSVVGLLIGFLSGQAFSSIYFGYLLFKKIHIGPITSNLSSSKELLKRYIDFPKYSLLAAFINGFINQLPLFLLNKFSGQASVGLYNMNNRILGLPIIVVSYSIGEVFRQRAASDYNKYGNCRSIFLKTSRTLFFLSIVPFLSIILFGEEIFAFVLGEDWRGVGVYTQILGIMYFFRFNVSPLTFLYYIAGKQREDFFVHLLMLISGFGALYLGYYIFGTDQKMLLFYSLAYSFIYLIYYFRSLALTVKNE